ncbi:MAG: hypothetical protein UY63_C0003G0023 [Parcubacteria group bacterium GW2011_GWA2_51_10]|nr:MAG: hypothetical protein UY63_C0003G0023 [Parcubacteria group bacterium GW2011_GWA2_51_10]
MRRLTLKRATQFVSRNVILVLAGAVIALALGVAVANAASNNVGVNISGQTKTEMHIAPSGQVLVRGAKVTAVASSTITSTVSFGSVNLAFVVKTDGSTHFVNRNERRASASDVSVGDTINFSGALDTSVSSLTVNARVVKNVSLPPTAAVTLRGTVESVSTSTQTMVVRTSSSTTTITISGSTSLRLDGRTAALADLRAGSAVHVVGSLNTATNTVAAERVVISEDDDDRREGMKEEIRGSVRGYLKSLFNGIGPFKFRDN